MIIDSHAHIFPDKIAEKAALSIGDFYDGMKIRYDGKLSTLLALGREAGIDKFAVHSVATVPEQVVSINNFIADSVREHPGKLIGYAAMHPDFEDIEGELDRAVSIGLKGVKLHPDIQRFAIDDERAMRIYRHIEGKLPILIHTGDYRFDWSKPKRMANVLRAFPKLTAIGAHFGGWSEWDDAVEFLTGFENFYVDTSSSLYAVSPERARELIDAFGAERVLFGSDYPMWDPAEELAALNKVALSESEKELIFHKNIERILG